MERKGKQLKAHFIPIVTLLFALILASCIIAPAYAEPNLIDILNNLGFTNIIETNFETFPPGKYNITLYAEFANYHGENELTYYEANTSNFTPIFTGPEGGSGYVSPITKEFTANYKLGFSLSRINIYPFRYFTENSRNPNKTQYAKVYRNLDEPSMFLIGFDERTYCDGTGDNDYNDMVFSIQLQYQVTFNQTGLDPTASGTIITINNETKTINELPYTLLVLNSTTITYSYNSEIPSSETGKNFVLTSVTGPTSPITITSPIIITGNYKTQYYLTVSSPYGTPAPPSGWFDADTSITASVISPETGPTGTRYVCTGWTGTGSVPASGIATAVTFTINQPSSITWNWKTQHYLTVKTSPSGITTIPGEGWHDEFTSVSLMAPSVTHYTFQNWDVDGISQGSGVTSITVNMNAPHTATANYQSIPPVGGTTVSIKSPTVDAWKSLNAILITAIFITASWIKSRQKKNSQKTLSPSLS